MPSATLHPPGIAVPGVAGCGGSEGLVGLEMGSGWRWMVLGGRGGVDGGRKATEFTNSKKKQKRTVK